VLGDQKVEFAAADPVLACARCRRVTARDGLAVD
jgi:hypothetical protein